MTLTDWVTIIKDCFLSEKTKYAISKEIKATCLESAEKIMGMYRVNDDLVWKNIILRDQECLKAIKLKKIHDITGLQSWFVEYDYQNMRASYGRAHTRRR